MNIRVHRPAKRALEARVVERIRRGLLREALIGTLAGLCVAGLYLLLGANGNELTEFLAYSLVLVGFPAVFAVSPLLNWLGIGSGLAEYVGLVLLALPLNGTLWGACLGALLTPPIPPSQGDQNEKIARGAA
jgi:hypothetical protein